MLQIRLDEEAVLKTVGQKWLWGSSPYCSAEERVISFGIALYILYENLVRKKRISY
jgi:hypothetical protein